MLYSWFWKIIILVEINYFFASKLYLEYFCHIYKYLVRLQIRDCIRKNFLIFNYLFFSTYQFAFKISIFRNSNSRKEIISLCNLSLRSSNTYHQMRTVKKCAVFGNLRKKNLYRGFILNTTLCHSLSDVFVFCLFHNSCLIFIIIYFTGV